jgi:hypothetical protein
MAKQKTATPKVAAKQKTTIPTFKIGELVIVKGQDGPCEIVEKHKTKKQYRVYVKTKANTLKRSDWINASALKEVPKEA